MPATALQRQDTDKAKGWLLFLCVAIIWTIEVAAIQEYTLDPRFVRYFSWIGKHAIRWGVDFFCIVFLLSILRIRMAAFLMFLHAVLAIVLVTYSQYFHIPLSEQIIFSQTSEGAEFAGFALQLVNLKLVAALALLFALKLFLLSKAHKIAWKWRGGIDAAISAVCIAGLAAVSFIWLPSVSSVTQGQSWQLYAEVYGYLPAWGINGFFFGSKEDLLRKAMENSSPITPTAHLPTIGERADNIVIIQVESLDLPMLEAKADDGSPVMPFLGALRKKSLFYAGRPDHTFGTSTADFAMCSGYKPGGDITPYKIDGFPFDKMPSLARHAAGKGFKTFIFHGNKGYFYNRQEPMRAMGFEHLYFLDDMVAAGLPMTEGYISDKDLFDFSLSQMHGKQNLHFLITVSSHAPWTLQPEVEKVPCTQGPPLYKDYVASMRYVDNCLKDYVSGLPPNTLLFLYGDHSSGLEYAGNEAGLVPIIIFKQGSDLSKLPQETPSVAEPVDFYNLVYMAHAYIDAYP